MSQSTRVLVTAMLPPGGKRDANFGCIIVGPANADPYPEHGDAIVAALESDGYAVRRLDS